MQCSCCEHLFSKSVIPLMLSCGHTICNLCVDKIQAENFPCPHCVRPYICSTPNLTLCSQIDSIPQIKRAFCDICKEQHLATVKCFDCDQFLCDLMAQSHKLLTVVSDHKLVSISELPTDESVLQCLHPKKCSSHRRPYTHYNESINGSHLLCVYCATEKAHLLTSHPSLPLSSASLSQRKVQEARAFSRKISERISSLTTTSQTLSDKIQQLDQSRDLAQGQIQDIFQTYRQALDAREAELKGRVDELHKSARFEMEEEVERASLYLGQLEQYAKGLEEMEASLTLANVTFPFPSFSSTSPSIPVPESLLVDVCLLEASLRSSFSHSMEVEVSPTEKVEFRMSKEEEGWKEKMLELGTILSFSSSSIPPVEGLEFGRNLIDASEKGELEVVRALLDQGDDIHQTDEDGWNALYIACSKGHLPIVSLLLERGANNHEKNKNGSTALFIASQKGYLPIVSLFLEKGAKINEKSKYGFTALHIACANGYLPIASLLLDKGANINEKNDNEYTALFISSRKGHLPIVSLLLDRGANIHEKNNDGWTPLHISCSKGHLSIVSLLLDRGANINEMTNFGKTPLKLAQENENDKVSELLKSKGARQWLLW